MEDEGKELLRLLQIANEALYSAELWCGANGEYGYKDEIGSAESRVRSIIGDIERLRSNR